METDKRPVRNEALVGCNYVGENHCAQIGSCQISTLLRNLEDLEVTKATIARRNKLIRQAKRKNCRCLPLE